MKYANNLISCEILKQSKRWGLEHDAEEHGSEGLCEAARVICDQYPPDERKYERGQWFVELWYEHEHDPIHRMAIAAAMLASAIECKVYELGQRAAHCEEGVL